MAHGGNVDDATFAELGRFFSPQQIVEISYAASLGPKMRRREFITLLGGATTWPLAVHAQTERVRRIGMLMAYPEMGAPEVQHPTNSSPRLAPGNVI